MNLKPHLHGRLFCNAIRRFFRRENLARRVVIHTSPDSLAAIAFGKNRRRVSNTCDLQCRLYFARLDATIVLARDHLHEVDFNVSRVPGQSRARVNSKSYAIYESPGHSAMHKLMLCESLAAIILNLPHKILWLWYKTVCSAFTVINCDFDTKFTSYEFET